MAKTKLPKGFKSIKPLDGDEAKERMKEVLERVSLDMEGYDTDFRAFKNSNRSVDGELIVRTVPRNVPVARVIRDLEEAFPARASGMFFSVGLRYQSPEGIDSPDYRYRGLAEASTYYRYASLAGIADRFITAQDIDLNMKTKKNPKTGERKRKGSKDRRPKAVQIFVRLHWNPDGKKPKRLPQRFKKSWL